MISRTMKPMRARHLVADVRWGIARAVLITALTWVPALLVFLGSGAVLDRTQRSEFVRYASGYLLLAVAGGVVLGVGRTISARSRLGAAIVGAWVGAQSLVLGMGLSDSRHWSEHGLLGVSAAIGVLIGAPLGLWFRARAAVWKARASKIELNDQGHR